jgi:hypothetical protein
VSLFVIDSGGKKSSTVTSNVTVSTSGSGSTGGGSSAGIAVFAGYYDDHHPGHTQAKPSPWKGGSNVVFVGNPDGSSGGWDTSAIRVDNLSGSSASITVTVDIGSHHYALWGARSVPNGSKLILAQTAFANFDGSDDNPAGCYGCDPKLCLKSISSAIPVVTVTIGAKTTKYYDNHQILNTHGVDGAGCPYTGTRNDESSQWVEITSTKAAVPLAAAKRFEPSFALSFAPPHPNPTSGTLGLEFTLPLAGSVTLSVFDVAGRKVKSHLDRSWMEAGAYHGSLDLGDLRPGLYLCRLTTPSGSLTHSIAVTP